MSLICYPMGAAQVFGRRALVRALHVANGVPSKTKNEKGQSPFGPWPSHRRQKIRTEK